MAIPAYCFMPDHLHLLVESANPDANLQRFIWDAKQRAAYAAKSLLRERLWQAGYYDRVLRENDDVIDVIRYIVQNPLRAGLASRPDEYPFVGSDVVGLSELMDACAWRPWERRRP